MATITVIAFNFIAGAAIAQFIHSVQSDFWKHMFEKHSTLEADEMQDAWYNSEGLIYFLIVIFGYVFMFLILFGLLRSKIRKAFKK